MNSSKRITTAALLASIYLIIVYLERFIGIGMLFFAIPLPIIIYCFIYGFKNGLIFYFCILLLTIPIDLIAAIFYALSTNILGLAYGTCLKKKNYNQIYLLIIATIICFISNIIAISQIGYLLGYSYLEEITLVESLFNFLINIFKLDIPRAILDKLIIATLVAIYLILSIIETIIIHILSILLLTRLKLITNIDMLIFDWKHPKSLKYFALFLYLPLIYCLINIHNSNNLMVIITVIIINLFLVTSFLYSFSLFIFWAKSRPNSKLLYFIGSTFILFLFPLFSIFGIILDFKK